MVDNREINIRASLGVAFSPDDGTDFEELLKNADSALNEAKSKGKNNCVFFNEKIREKLEREQDIELELKNAINNEEFYLNFQPQFNISNNEYVGIEALLRWKNKKLGIVPPDEFISIAEKTGEIISVGEWVIKEIFKTVNEWDRYSINYKSVAINVSPIQLNESFLKFLKSQEVSQISNR
jgi:predicted signal transduction protein with EAL and GGDEF domain